MITRQQSVFVHPKILVAALLSLVAAGCGVPPQNVNEVPQQNVHMTWSPSAVDLNIGIGATYTKQVQLQSDGDIPSVRLLVPSVLQPFVVVQPSAFSLSKGKPQTVTLTFSVPPNTAEATLSGSIEANQSVAMLSSSLGLALHTHTGFVDPNLNLGIQIPSLGVPTKIQAATEGSLAFEIQAFSSQANSFFTIFGLQTFPNPAHLSLTAWFEQNVDLNGILLANNAFQQLSLSGGRNAMFLGGALPPAYLDAGGAPVETEYLMAPSLDFVISITQAQDHQLAEVDSKDSARQVERQIIESTQFFK